MNETPRGSIYAEEAYALGKMLDHSSWQHPRPGDEPLPRRITPSDIDMTATGGMLSAVPIVFDNRGKIVLGELSSHAREWHELNPGQRWTYESLLNSSPHCAVLCHHSVRTEERRLIDTRYDIDSFQVRINDHGIITLPVVRGNKANKAWQRFVLGWYRDPVMMRRILIAWHVKKHMALTSEASKHQRREIPPSGPKAN